MSHVTTARLHGCAARGLDVTVAIITELDPAEFTGIEFRVAGVVKSGLTADATADGFDVDLTLTAADLALPPDVYVWELVATLAGEVRTLGYGAFRLDAEPTEAA